MLEWSFIPCYSHIHSKYDFWKYFAGKGVLSMLNVLRDTNDSSPRDPYDALYQLKSWPTVVRMTQTDLVSACALSAIATFITLTA